MRTHQDHPEPSLHVSSGRFEDMGQVLTYSQYRRSCEWEEWHADSRGP